MVTPGIVVLVASALFALQIYEVVMVGESAVQQGLLRRRVFDHENRTLKIEIEIENLTKYQKHDCHRGNKFILREKRRYRRNSRPQKVLSPSSGGLRAVTQTAWSAAFDKLLCMISKRA